MAGYSQEVIDKYQSALKKDPNSQVFAPLADAYRESGQVDLAENICKKGIQKHPEFPGGWVILGKILKDKAKFDEAIKALDQAVKLSGDNILAHTLMGEIFLEKREPSKAIKSFKMVLFFNPHHSKVKKILEKIEALSAKDYSEEIFHFKKLNPLEDSPKYIPENTTPHIEPKGPEKKSAAASRSLLRVLSLIDAFIARNELKRAFELLQDVIKEFPDEKELIQRLKILKSKTSFSFTKQEPEIKTAKTDMKIVRQKQLQILNNLLQSIENRKSQY
ncbi:MAG: hypothetical protein KDD45_01945 [Bdellovibrionales bacterium]|nr:hypothetical protein [Bdellovibrionales bacterium]